MKRQFFILCAIALFGMTIMIPACKSSKTGKKPENMSCFGKEYRSTADYLRASQTATSQDKAIAIKMATLRAKEDLAQKMHSTIEFATEEYIKNFLFDSREDLKIKFRDYALNYGSVTLSFVRTICEEMYEKKNGKYEYYVAIEIDTETVMKTFEKGLRDEEIDLEFDRQQLRQIYERKIEEFREQNY